MSDLLLRSLAAVVMMAIALIAVLEGGYVFAVLVAAAATAVFYEWTRLTRGRGAGWYAAGFAYALVAALALLWVRDRSDNGIALVIWLFVTVWATDIGAYLTGRAVGGAKLAPAISPNKTWAGFYGGIVAASLLGGAWAMFTGLAPLIVVAAPIFSVIAQAGDLFESAMKRRAGVKDSGSWLPGHGGLFDRLDGLLPVAILTGALVLAGLA